MDKFDTSSPRRAQVDTKAVRRQVRSILHSLDRMRSSEAYWHVGAVANEVRQLLEQGQNGVPASHYSGQNFVAVGEFAEVAVGDGKRGAAIVLRQRVGLRDIVRSQAGERLHFLGCRAYREPQQLVRL